VIEGAGLPTIKCRFSLLTVNERLEDGTAAKGDGGVEGIRARWLWLGAAAVGVAVHGMGQGQATQPGAVSTPAVAAPSTTLAGHPDNEYWRSHDRGLAVDFGDLEHFKAADAALGPPAAGEARVVFLGDSITQGWKLEESFPGKAYVNRGISGETTPQMLVRFRQDVIDLRPKVVVILGGTNDLAGNTGPMTLKETEGNLESMVELARANGIGVVLCSVLPAFDFPWSPGLEPAPKIATLDAWLKDFAARTGIVYVDYYAAMRDERGGLPATLSGDGVHPLPSGYAVMAPLVEAGIERAEKQGIGSRD
jgi:acyl-CoA thioesterase I